MAAITPRRQSEELQTGSSRVDAVVLCVLGDGGRCIDARACQSATAVGGGGEDL